MDAQRPHTVTAERSALGQLAFMVGLLALPASFMALASVTFVAAVAQRVHGRFQPSRSFQPDWPREPL